VGFETYLVEAANRMDQLLAEAEAYPQQKQHKLREAAVTGCRALERLSKDESFRRAVEELTRARRQNRRGFGAITRDSDKFELFLGVERTVLIKGGITEDSANKLVSRCRDTLRAVQGREAKPDEVFLAVDELRGSACHRAEYLKRKALEAEEMARIKKTLDRVTLAIVGAALVGLNSSALVDELLTLAGRAVSAAIGAELISWAVSS